MLIKSVIKAGCRRLIVVILHFTKKNKVSYLTCDWHFKYLINKILYRIRAGLSGAQKNKL